MNTNRFQSKRRVALSQFLGVGPWFWGVSAVAAAGICAALYCLLNYRLSI
jgi:hypothetical protein